MLSHGLLFGQLTIKLAEGSRHLDESMIALFGSCFFAFVGLPDCDIKSHFNCVMTAQQGEQQRETALGEQ